MILEEITQGPLLRVLLHWAFFITVPDYPSRLVVLDTLVVLTVIIFSELSTPKNGCSKLGQAPTLYATLFGGVTPVLCAAMAPEQVEIGYLFNFALMGIICLSNIKLADITKFLTVNYAAWLLFYSGSYLGAFAPLRYDNRVAFILSLSICCYAIIRAKKASEEREAELLKLKTQIQNQEANENVFLKFTHELRNPLNSLVGSIELATGIAHNDELREHLRNARISSEFLLHIVNNLLDVSKSKCEKLAFNPQKRDFLDFMESFWGMTSSLIKMKGIDGWVEVSKGVPRFMNLDQHRISQILLNLVSNALKYTEKGSIRILFDFHKGSELDETAFESTVLQNMSEDIGFEQTYANTPRQVEFTPSKRSITHRRKSLDAVCFELLRENSNTTRSTAHPAEEYLTLNLTKKRFSGEAYQTRHEECEGFLRIEVVDSGCGMTPEQLERLFTKYGQVSEDSEMRQKGTGLGLWITKELCVLMGGDVRVSSFKGIGTSFIVMIKTRSFVPTPGVVVRSKDRTFSKRVLLKYSSDQPSIVTFHMKEPSNSSILIADDTIYAQDVTKKLFNKAGVNEVVCVATGEEAVQEYKKRGPKSFAFIILDLNMPVMDGMEAAKKIREYESSRGMASVPIIFLTGESSESKEKVCLDKEGVIKGYKYIVKPLLFKDIQEIVNELYINKPKGKESLDFEVSKDEGLIAVCS